MDLLEKFAPKKKYTLVLTNVEKRAVGGITYSPEKGRKKKKKTFVLANVKKRAVRGVLHTRQFRVFEN
jgi:hypothetical protein